MKIVDMFKRFAGFGGASAPPRPVPVSTPAADVTPMQTPTNDESGQKTPSQGTRNSAFPPARPDKTREAGSPPSPTDKPKLGTALN